MIYVSIIYTLKDAFLLLPPTFVPITLPTIVMVAFCVH